MQACPYDALYIDPNKGTAAKCNYCAHRIEHSYEPSCVIVCPVEAIISGDLDDPNSSISGYLSEHETTVRKPESELSQMYSMSKRVKRVWTLILLNAQENTCGQIKQLGVGHFAKYAEKRAGAADTQSMIIQLALEKKARAAAPRDRAIIRDVMDKLDDEENVKRGYDQPSKAYCGAGRSRHMYSPRQ